MSNVPFDLTDVEHHPVIEEIVSVLCNKTQNTDKSFFRAEVAFFLGKMASCMRASIDTKDRGNVPINIYTLALGSSGYGKGYSMNVMETQFCNGFRTEFLNNTMPAIADAHIEKIGTDVALAKNTDINEEVAKLNRAYDRAGEYPFTFDSGTSAAVKQLREKLLLAGSGSINLAIDEIGANLINNTEILNVYLELYDQGIVKQKLVKNTADNIRTRDIEGKTPANMMLFGTPANLMDGSQTEEQFYSFLETGFGRRCLFGYGEKTQKAYNTMDPAEIFDRLVNPNNDSIVDKWATHFRKLADRNRFQWCLDISDEVSIKLLEYKIKCEELSDGLPDHEAIRKAELNHRYFKALKLAGAYAFVDESMDVTMDHLLQAILLVEESGKAFEKILHREKTYVRLAKYIASVDAEVTHADLNEALPFYKSGQAARNEMMTLAVAWGYKNNILIQQSYVDGIDFFSGESLKETDLNELTVSYSTDWAANYTTEKAPFHQLYKLTQADGLNWCNHGFKYGHRSESNVIKGFNMAVLDVDGSCDLATATSLLENYTFMAYTTKRHTEDENRFRIVIPLKYNLELDSKDYKEFINNLLDWMPFDSDPSTNQRSKKWLSCSTGTYQYNDADLLDPVQFIPKTSKNDVYLKNAATISDLGNLERWFAREIAEGNRNNHILRYALILVDTGLPLVEVGNRVHTFNKRLKSPLDASEIDSTIMRSVAKHYKN